MPKAIEIIGKIFDDLKVLSLNAERSTAKKKYYDCECQICKRIYPKRKDAITNKIGTRHKACVYLIEDIVDEQFKHAWENMRARTDNENFKQYHNYGGRGIDSKEFELFIDFYDNLYEDFIIARECYGDVRISLDRIDTNGNYTRENVRWVSHKEQNENLSTTYKVRAIKKDDEKEVLNFESLHDASLYFDIHPEAIKNRASFPNKKYKKELGYEFYIYKNY